MNIIKLDDEALSLTCECRGFVLHLAELAQRALNPLRSGKPGATDSPMSGDLQSALREGTAGRMGLHAPWVIQDTLTRTIGLMDNLLGLAVLLDATHDQNRRTGSSTTVLARSALDTGCAVAYYLDGTLEDRLLRAYASHLGDLQQVFLAYQPTLFPKNAERDDLANRYSQLYDRADELGYTLNTDEKRKTCGRPRVNSVIGSNGNKAQAEPNTTDRARDFGTQWAQHQWRTASGATHGRIWALLPVQTQLESEAASSGSTYFTATMTAWEGARVAVHALATYSGLGEVPLEFDRVSQSFLGRIQDGPK